MLAISKATTAAVVTAAGRGGGGGGGGAQQRASSSGRSSSSSRVKQPQTRKPRRATAFSSVMEETVSLTPPPDGTPRDEIPRLIVYDLDDTVWFPELYMMAGASRPAVMRDPSHRPTGYTRVTRVCDVAFTLPGR
mmetsp:Transcript_36016/g.88739  ORF Transcript_36016/g.88739 Transcript_36016/m.88739 type:complete len:135 (-) Transcript_36016:130-534(-)